MSRDKKQIREVWRAMVFHRDKGRCVACTQSAVDAHHIIDRSAFPDGGYDINNGVSLCEECHLKAEDGRLSPTELRERAKIRTLVLPDGWDEIPEYDKWGRVVAPISRFPTDITLRRRLRQSEIRRLTNDGEERLRALIRVDVDVLADSSGDMMNIADNRITPGAVDECLSDVRWCVWDCVPSMHAWDSGDGQVILLIDADASEVVDEIIGEGDE